MGIGAQDQPGEVGGAAGGGLFHHVLAVHMHGVVADAEQARHFLVGQAEGQQTGHFTLPRRQAGQDVLGLALATLAGVEEIAAGLLPADKAAYVRRMQDEGHVVGMVGDGINDAPALAAANVGMAVGTGVDVSAEAGDIVLMRDGMEAVLTALALSRATMRNIRQNLFWAFGYNVLGLPVAAGLLHAFGGPMLSPMLAGTAMALSSVSVVTNALRLRFFKITR